jgi:hypothetical protein
METSGVQLFVRSRLCVAANTQHDQRWNSGMLFLAALVFQLGVSCNSGGTAAQPDRESPKPRGLALATSGVAPADVMGFETAGAWSTTTVGAVLAQSSTHSQGASSLSVRPSNKNGYTPIASVPLTTLSGVSTALALDIMLPTQQPNPRWLGTVQMYLNCPSRSIFSQFLAQAELTGKPLNVWNTISFPLTNAQVSGLLSAGYSDLTITIVLNVQVPTTGTYFIDNLRFVPVAANACGGKPNGTACTDGNACTLGDTCQSGSCRPGTPTVCPSPDQCHTTASCNPATGLCSNPAKADGSACSDGNACTQTDTCQSGRCVGGNPKVCSVLDQCHVAGVCNTTTGVCSNPAKADGSACDDGNACTQTDTCHSGSCVGGNPKVCAAIDQCHVPGVCDTATGVCPNPAKADGSACDDGNACTQTDLCQSGSCVGGNAKVCAALDQCHIAGVCDATTGACSNPVKANGSSCDDGNACTQSDSCQNGSCVGSNAKLCTALDQCHVAGACNPATGVCSNPAKADGTLCEDGNACTKTDNCQSGSCVGNNPVVCTALDQCHVVGTCNTATGVCSNPNRTDGSPCSDGNACTKTDTCVAGNCVGGNPVTCSALDACHQAGACDPATGQCSNPAISCDDQNPCTTDGCDPTACKPDHCEAKDICAHVLTYGPACTEPPAPPPPPSDIAITNAAISADGAIIRPGQTVPLTYTLQTSAAYADFSAEFVLFPVQVPGNDSPVTGVSLGGARLATVPAGSSQYSVWVPIPSGAPPGTYNLYGHRYPDGEFWQGTDVYTIQAEPVLPSFDLPSYRAGSVQMFIDQDSTVDPNNLTLYRPLDHSGMLGIVSRSQGATQVPVRAYLYWPDPQSPPQPLQIWDHSNQTYVSTLLVNGLKADQSQTLLLDLALPEAAAQQLRAVIPVQTPMDTQILITINESPGVPEAPCPSDMQDSCRHQIQVPVTLFLPPPDSSAPEPMMHAFAARESAPSSSPLKYQHDWAKDAGNKYFYAGIHFHADAQLSKDGLSTTVQGWVPVQIPTYSFDLGVIRADFAMSAPIGGTASASGTFSVGCNSVGCATTYPVFTAPGGTFSYQNTYSIASASMDMVIVFVPVSGTISVDAVVDLSGTIDATSETDGASLNFTPSLQVSLNGSAHFDAGIPGILEAGAEGTVQLVGATLGATISGSCSVAPEGNWDVVTGNLAESMTISGEMLSGTVDLYVEYPSFKWCKAWGIPYPCGFQISRPTVDLCSWDGITVGSGSVYHKNQDGFKINKACSYPNTCAVGVCGTIDNGNGCGGPLVCGDCGDSEHACVNHLCQCSVTCQALGWTCGTGTTACTSALNCGACQAGQYCSSNVCKDCSGTTPKYGEACSSCGGTTQCDGSCSKPDPPGYGTACGSCGGSIGCDGKCRNTPANYGTSCDVNSSIIGACGGGGTIACSGACQPADAEIGDSSKWHSSMAPNGSWDWDCDGGVTKHYPDDTFVQCPNRSQSACAAQDYFELDGIVSDTACGGQFSAAIYGCKWYNNACIYDPQAAGALFTQGCR